MRAFYKDRSTLHPEEWKNFFYNQSSRQLQKTRMLSMYIVFHNKASSYIGEEKPFRRQSKWPGGPEVEVCSKFYGEISQSSLPPLSGGTSPSIPDKEDQVFID